MSYFDIFLNKHVKICGYLFLMLFVYMFLTMTHTITIEDILKILGVGYLTALVLTYLEWKDLKRYD